MELSNGDGGVAKAARTPVTQVRKSSALSSASPPPHNRTARKTQQNRGGSQVPLSDNYIKKTLTIPGGRYCKCRGKETG